MRRYKKVTRGIDTRLSPYASNRRGGIRRSRPRDTEPMGPVAQPKMTSQQKREYYQGPKATQEQIQTILRGSHSFGRPLGYKASELGLSPGDWDDPRYREAYKYFMIYREDIEDEEKDMEPDDPYDNLELDLSHASD